MTFHLIRHGRTLANEKGLYCGFTDIPLSDNGKKELMALKERLNYPKPELCITSGLLRTLQTAELLYGNPKYVIAESLKEMNFGDFEMKRHDELKINPDYIKWLGDFENERPPHGESLPEFRSRIMSGFYEAERTAKEKALKSVAIVTHGGVIAVILNELFPGKEGFYEWIPDCGRGYTISLDRRKTYEFKQI